MVNPVALQAAYSMGFVKIEDLPYGQRRGQSKQPKRASRSAPYGYPSGSPAKAPRCGAKTRRGSPCQAPAMRNAKGRYTRCRLHGGASTGPQLWKAWNGLGVRRGSTDVTPPCG